MKWLVGLACGCCVLGAAVAASQHWWPVAIVNAALALVAAGLWRAA